MHGPTHIFWANLTPYFGSQCEDLDDLKEMDDELVAEVVSTLGLKGATAGLLTQGVPGFPQDPWRPVEDSLDPFQIGTAPDSAIGYAPD